jgi:hypothetical protein
MIEHFRYEQPDNLKSTDKPENAFEGLHLGNRLLIFIATALT